MKWYGDFAKAVTDHFARIGQHLLYWLVFHILAIVFAALLIGFFISFMLF